MSNNPPNFNPNNPQGRLVVGRQDFQSHIEGVLTPNGANLSHNATAIKVVPPLTVGLNSCANLDEAIRALSDSLVSITFSGDLSGTDLAQTVVGIQGTHVVPGVVNGYVLTVNSDGYYQAMPPAASGFPAGAVNGDIIFYQGGQWNLRHIGTTGQVLTVFEGDPAWETASGIEIFKGGTPVDGYDSLGVDGTTITLSYPSGVPTISAVASGVSLSGTNTWTGQNTFSAGLQLSSNMSANDAVISLTAGSSINAATGSEILINGSIYFTVSSTHVEFDGAQPIFNTGLTCNNSLNMTTTNGTIHLSPYAGLNAPSGSEIVSDGSTYFQTGSQVGFYGNTQFTSYGDAYFLKTVATGSENVNELYANNIVKAWASIPLYSTGSYLVNGGSLQDYVNACVAANLTNGAGDFFGFNLGASSYDNIGTYDNITFVFTQAFTDTNYSILCFIDNGVATTTTQTISAGDGELGDSFPTTNAAQNPSTSQFVLFAFSEAGTDPTGTLSFLAYDVQRLNILVIGTQ